MKIQAFTVRDNIPTWRPGGIWSYELGIAALVLWLAECVSRLDEVTDRFTVPRNIFAWMRGDQNAIALAMCGAAGLIILAYVLRHTCPAMALCMRVAGLCGASLSFCAIAASFLLHFAWSFGGPAYAFLCWRTLAVAGTIARCRCP